MDESRQSSGPAKAHDLRHQFALLAVDLRLCRDRLAERDGETGLLLPELLNRLERGLERGRRILSEGAAPWSPDPRDHAGLAEELWESFLRAGRLRSESSRLELFRPWLPEAPEDAIYALLLNLIENACKAAPKGPVRLVLDRGGLLIENGGEPLPPAIATALNEGRAPRARGEHGRGLEAILRRARSLGLSVEASSGKSTRLRFRRRGGPRVLLVEDDPSLRCMLAEWLRRDGFEVEDSAGFAGLSLEEGSWSAAIADLGLPGEAGDSGLARLKRSHPRTRTLLLTGARERAGDAIEGVDRIIVKPGLAILERELREVKERSL